MHGSQKEGKAGVKAAVFPDEQVPASCPLRITEVTSYTLMCTLPAFYANAVSPAEWRKPELKKYKDIPQR